MAESEPSGRRPLFQASVEMRLIYDRLLKAKVGELVPYEELSELTGTASVRESCNGAMQSARRRALNQDSIVFEAVWNEGLKRLADPEIVETAERDRRRAQNAAKRTVRRLSCIRDFDALDRPHQIQHNTAMSLSSVLAQLTKPSSVKRLQERVEAANGKPLPLAKTLEVFRSKA